MGNGIWVCSDINVKFFRRKFCILFLFILGNGVLFYLRKEDYGRMFVGGVFLDFIIILDGLY